MRSQLVWMLIAGAMAGSALAASTASAAEPAFFECASMSGGAFANSACTKASAPGKGRYELKQGISATHAFKAFDKRIELATPELEPFIACGEPSKPGKITGELTSPTTIGDVIITAGNCEVGCTNSKGKLQIGPLSGQLGWINQEQGEVGFDLSGEDGHPIARFLCGVEQVIRGSLVAGWTGNVNVEKGKGERHFGLYESLEGGEPDMPSLLTSRGAEEVEEPITVAALSVAKLTLPKGVEIKG